MLAYLQLNLSDDLDSETVAHDVVDLVMSHRLNATFLDHYMSKLMDSVKECSPRSSALSTSLFEYKDVGFNTSTQHLFESNASTVRKVIESQCDSYTHNVRHIFHVIASTNVTCFRTLD